MKLVGNLQLGKSSNSFGHHPFLSWTTSWLVVEKTPLKKIRVRHLGWLDIPRNPIFLGKYQFHGNHSPPTSDRKASTIGQPSAPGVPAPVRCCRPQRSARRPSRGAARPRPGAPPWRTPRSWGSCPGGGVEMELSSPRMMFLWGKLSIFSWFHKWLVNGEYMVNNGNIWGFPARQGSTPLAGWFISWKIPLKKGWWLGSTFILGS